MLMCGYCCLFRSLRACRTVLNRENWASQLGVAGGDHEPIFLSHVATPKCQSPARRNSTEKLGNTGGRAGGLSVILRIQKRLTTDSTNDQLRHVRRFNTPGWDVVPQNQVRNVDAVEA